MLLEECLFNNFEKTLAERSENILLAVHSCSLFTNIKLIWKIF